MCPFRYDSCQISVTSVLFGVGPLMLAGGQPNFSLPTRAARAIACAAAAKPGALRACCEGGDMLGPVDGHPSAGRVGAFEQPFEDRARAEFPNIPVTHIVADPASIDPELSR